MKKIKLLFCLFSLFIFNFSLIHAQGTWTKVNNLAPISEGGGMVLLTDGRVMCKGYYAAVGFPGSPDNSWMVLTPDIHGSYANGTWSVLAPENDTRSVFSSQVLPTGNVYVAGGEHGSGGSSAELYNTVTNSWSYLPNIPGWGIYDGNSELLYDGTVIQGCALIYNPDTTILMYNPVAGKLNAGPHSIGSQEETSWLKLPDSSILYVNTISTTSERYIPQQHKWVADANVPVQLYDPSSEETGPAVLLPNGKGFFIGDVGQTAIYTPSGNINPGTWTTGPNEPKSANNTQLGSWDGPGAMMVNGHALYSISPLASESLPSYFYEYDYVSNTWIRLAAPGGGDSVETQTNMMSMLELPDGTILFAYTDSTLFYIYTPSGAPLASGKPVIDGVFPDSCNKYMITGKLFNGISEGAGFGDDWQMVTNYPLIRLTSGTNVYYAKTTKWNIPGAVMTDSTKDTAYFTLPSLPGGTYSLVVVANGIASNPVPFTTFGVSITSTNIISCHGKGEATVSASNGSPPYTYMWSNGSTNAYDSNLVGGTYTVTVTENGGCSMTASVTITQPGSILLTPTITEVSCDGGNNGKIIVSASGGLVPYTYNWSTGATTTSISNLTAGTYTLIVSDSCGFNATASVNITQPPALNVVTGTSTNNHCYGDSSGISNTSVSGGSPPYTYLWAPGGSTYANNTGLTADTYTLTVTDACGNTATASVTITSPPALNVIMDSVNVTTSPICNGKAKVTVSGGNPPYTYHWLPGNQTTDSIYNQCSGAYCCTITDNSGCSKSKCIVINNTTGVENIASDNGQVTIYPNPSNGKFTIQLSGVRSQNSVVEIYNMLGEKVFYATLNQVQDDNTFDLSSNSSGIYLYRIITDAGRLVGEGKFVIQK